LTMLPAIGEMARKPRRKGYYPQVPGIQGPVLYPAAASFRYCLCLRCWFGRGRKTFRS